MLEQYEAKKIRVTTKDKNVYIGFAGDYVEPINNDNGEESLILDIEGNRFPIEIYANEIMDIAII